MMKRRSAGRTGRRYTKQLLISIFWPMAVSVAVAQDFYDGYRFAPRLPEDAGDGGYGAQARPGTDALWSHPAPPLTGPGGRPYRFRNGTESPQAARQPVFRPDTRLGQQPKNWSADPSWASDPVLQQGLVFRPLPKKKDSGKSRNDRGGHGRGSAAPPPYPYTGGDMPGAYPGPYGWGFSDDPYLGVPGWSYPGAAGGWTPGW